MEKIFFFLPDIQAKKCRPARRSQLQFCPASSQNPENRRPNKTLDKCKAFSIQGFLDVTPKKPICEAEISLFFTSRRRGEVNVCKYI